MTNEQILKKAIQKAVKNGYRSNFAKIFLDRLAEGKIFMERGYDFIFSHDFAKAFWKDEELVTDFPNWKWNLQQMVLEKDPIKYLKKFLDTEHDQK